MNVLKVSEHSQKEQNISLRRYPVGKRQLMWDDGNKGYANSHHPC